MNRQCIMEVIDLIRDDISHEKMRSFAISPEQQTFAALRFYANGSFQQVTGDIMGISQSSVSRIVQQVSTAISRQAGRFITFPVTAPQQQSVKEGFKERFGFPNVLGCVNGTLIQIKAPSVREDVYVCRKGYHALNIQGICDSRKAFLNLVVRWPGSTHDAFIWSECGINNYLNQNPNAGYLLGDQAYPLKQFLLTPKRNPLNDADHAFKRWLLAWGPCLPAETVLIDS
ncbi:HARBI1 [Mytilus coruscus]|uniref:Putative nuclease HARBI1 n=1 Tax=Mytilus coruscus TaxID=42192 RepID=A0A6J8BY25_MYTCO|nr:HARBI1 [Mytilus coruscus]